MTIIHTLFILSGTSLGDNDVIVLAPPTSVSVTEGDTVSLPCVGSRGAVPVFSPTGAMQTSSQFSLDFSSITASASGMYTCQIGGTSASVTVNVAALSESPFPN